MESNINMDSLIDHPFYDDPFLRELHCDLTKAIKIDRIRNSIDIYDRTKRELINTIELSDFTQLCWSLNTKSVLNPDGKIHEWVSEADGSADRLRAFLGINKT